MKMKSNGSFLQKVLIVFVFTGFSKVIGFLKESQIANTFGATYLTDAYSVALQIPTLIFEVLGVAITTCFIPVASTIYASDGKKKFDEFARLILTLTVLLSAVLFVLTYFAGDKLILILAPGFSNNQFTATFEMVKISAFILFLMPFISCLTAVLQIQDRFTLTSALSIVLNLPAIVYLLYGTDIKQLMLATCLGYVCQVVVLVFNVRSTGMRIYPNFSFRDRYLKKMIITFLPVLLGIGVKELNTIVDRVMASYLPAGNISHYNYASRIENAITVLVSSAFLTVFFPKISKMSTDENEFRCDSAKALRQILPLILPTAVTCIALGKPIIQFLYERGAFTPEDTYSTTIIFIILCIGIVFHGLRDFFNRLYYALGETKKTTVYSTASLVINIIGNLILIRIIGVYGLAVANVLSAIVVCCLLFVSLNRRLKGFLDKETRVCIVKTILASIIMAIAIQCFGYCIGLMNVNLLITLIVQGSLGFFAYIMALYFMGVDELRVITDLIKAKVQRGEK